MTARSLLTRGPCCAEPSEAHAETVPVGKRTAREVQEKVAPPEGRYKANLAVTLRGHEGTAPKEEDECAITLEWIGRIRHTPSGVVDENGVKITARAVSHTAEGLGAWGRSWTSGVPRASTSGPRSSGPMAGWWIFCSTMAWPSIP